MDTIGRAQSDEDNRMDTTGRIQRTHRFVPNVGRPDPWTRVPVGIVRPHAAACMRAAQHRNRLPRGLRRR